MEIAIIGGGSAGLCAAVSAAKNGAKTILIEGTGGIAGDLTSGLPAEIAAIQEQYEYYRNKLLTFKQVA